MSRPEKELSAVLYSDTEPTDRQRQRVVSFLTRKYQCPVTLDWKREENLKGGFRLEAGADVYDWSLEGRVRQFKERLQQLRPARC